MLLLLYADRYSNAAASLQSFPATFLAANVCKSTVNILNQLRRAVHLKQIVGPY